MTARWSVEQAKQWRAQRPWYCGANFLPSTAINQLEMWMAETFDPETIDRELGFAQSLGMNAMRVYLHDLVWSNDRDGLFGRMRQYLDTAAGRSIDTLFVIFDDCWLPDPAYGPQKSPEPCRHNPGWVQSPGRATVRDPSRWAPLETYVTDVLTTFGDDKDRVLYRSTGEPTYFASDVGYVREKFSRGYDKLIYVWGADHHGTVARVRNAAEAMGFDKEAVEMLMVAWVRFVRDGEEIPMSKRSGEFLTLDELLEEIGVDAARWSFASRAASTPTDVDIELARRQSSENPVYYVQYAHARICSILAKAEEAGLRPASTLAGAIGNDDTANGLAREALRLPEIVEDSARSEDAHGITAYALELATTFHAFYRDRRVIDEDAPEVSAQRLALIDATAIAIRNALELLGISAPRSM